MSLKGASIYEQPLDRLPLDDRQVPTFLEGVCGYIQEFSSCIGLFRQCGQHLLMADLGVVFQHRDTAMPPCSTVYDAAAFLKKWVRALPVPLLTPAVINGTLSTDDPDSVRACLRALSVPARRTFARICRVIEAVLAHSQVNQMSFQNLSFCFFENITQNGKDLARAFPLKFFYQNAMLLLNEDKDDFLLDRQLTPDIAVPFDPAQTQGGPNLDEMRRLIQSQS
jgi:hypothetical protein